MVPLGLPDEDPTYSHALLSQIATDGIAYVPPLFWDELTNILVSAIEKHRTQLIQAERFLLKVSEELPLATVGPVSRLEVLHTAHDYGLTGYDAVYLTLALQQEAQLATLDKELLAAAKRGGIPTYQPQAV